MRLSATNAPDSDLNLYTVADAMRMLRMSRAVLYDELRARRLRSVLRGRRRLFTATAIRQYIATLEEEGQR